MTHASGGGHRKGISVAAAVAVVFVATVAAAAVYLYPLISGGNKTTYTTTTGQTGWQPWAVANITLTYYMTQTYIYNAYSYSFNASQTASNPVVVSALIHAFGPMIVYGNWTTGFYATQFAYDSTLNVSVRYTPPGRYQIIGFFVQNQTVQGGPSYDSYDQKEVLTAMSNSSVRSYLAQFPSYVNWASFFYIDSSNKTYGGDDVVRFYQVNEAKFLGVFINPNTNLVVNTYIGSRAIRTCLSNNYCYSSPWGS